MIFVILTHKLYHKISQYNYIYWIFIYRGTLTDILYSFVKGHKKGPVSFELNVASNQVYDSVHYYIIFLFFTMHFNRMILIRSQKRCT